MFFKILKKSPGTRAKLGAGQVKTSRARRGKIYTSHGIINTPCFMPIATRGAVKNLTPDELEKIGAEIILGNTYHLYLRPGEKLVKKSGGLHRFINWKKPILTDSGGFQVFSLAKMRKISEKGVEFRSPIDGAKHFLTPEKSMQIQLDLGSDIIMAFDECTPYPATRDYAKNSLKITYRWAARCKKYFEKAREQNFSTAELAATGRLKQSSHEKFIPLSFRKLENNFSKHFLFGIIQGSTFKDLRQESAKQIVDLDTDGVAIGGVSVGEPPEKMLDVLDWVAPYLPENKPHYLMGVGYPDQIVEAVKRGIDMFDCVIPTRNGRHGELFVWSASGRTKNINVFRNKNFYSPIHITNKKFTTDFGPVDKACRCYTCQNFSRAYLRHLFIVKENLGLRLATIHNLAFYLELMRKIRKEI